MRVSLLPTGADILASHVAVEEAGGAAGVVAEEADVVKEERGVSGSRHISSCTSCVQYIIMEVYSYHFL